MTINLTPILEAIIALCFSLLCAYFLPWLKAHTTEEQFAHIKSWVSVAVYAAEKLYGTGNGAEKFAYAKSILEQHSIDVDIDTLKALIDAEILKMEQAEGGTIELVEAPEATETEDVQEAAEGE